MMKSSEIRQKFLDFFASKGHTIVRSSSLVPGNDPTLLFTNSGMVQFKDVFLGTDKRPYARATSAQRCVRAGGKHNDLENVGYTARHHTFFEMLGNFSFGDYFKREAISFAWELLTSIYKLPPEKLWVTVYHQDDEAYQIWNQEIKVPADRIIRIGDNKGAPYASDNFWQMADTGPCGPCSEIFYDHGPSVAGGPPGSPDADGDRYIEIWNLVFMQFNRDEQGTMHRLPKPCVDTGMGLERVTAVLQHVHSNYEIDLFQSLIKAAAKATGVKQLESPSLKVIADHLRSACFLIIDGVFPSNEGRGYVLRRIIRRALRHGHQLGCHHPFFYQLVYALIKEMGEAYPELVEKQNVIEQALKDEESRFGQTLSNGMSLLETAITEAKQKNTQQPVLSGETIFKLYDTYGFPFDLTADFCREKNVLVDDAGFEKALEEQRDRARGASKLTSQQNLLASLDIQTADTQFEGYQATETESVVQAIFKDGQSVDRLHQGESGVVVLDQTPFYAESGGQVGDKGVLSSCASSFEVQDTQKIKNQIIGHQGIVSFGSIKVGDSVEAKVNQNIRQATARHHSATHLLHKALKLVLGDHVSQKGSLVDQEKTRFDFSHPSPLTAEQIQLVERWVNQQIIANTQVKAEQLSFDQAISKGATALFGEKYGDEVRMLSIGETIELCGGTHVKRTGDLGLFTITSEGAIASGVRRIEAVCGEVALKVYQTKTNQIQQVAQLLKSNPEQSLVRLQQLLDDQKTQQKENDALKQKLIEQFAVACLSEVETASLGSLLITQVPAYLESKALRQVAEYVMRQRPPSVVLALMPVGEISQLVIASSPELSSASPNLAAPQILNWLQSQIEGGKGGGKGSVIQAGGFSYQQLTDHLPKIREYLFSLLG
jgi:alanyl-tRNA synthetase